MLVRVFSSTGRYCASTVAAGVLLLLCAVFPVAADTGEAVNAPSGNDAVTAMVARQEIEYLRRLYARATDLIGLNTAETIAEGRAIYRRIFTADAEILVTVQGEVTLSRKGPDGWVDVVIEALGTTFTTTQHMIGTQLVTIERLPSAALSGEASMTSYLQAWHDAEGEVDTFIGTYHDKVRYTPELGWRIYYMNLEQVAHEIRKRP
jgi:hypothetical protein